VLQGDIRLYFPSIDLTLLRQQLAERIPCPGTLWLLDQILANGATIGPALDAFPGDTLLTPLERPRGLPIGNLTSQFLANLHLDRFDHTISALPGIRAYLRYVDDFALFANSPEPLAPGPAHRIEAELAPCACACTRSRARSASTRDGASFVGFLVLPGRVRVRNHNLRKGIRRLRLQRRAVISGRLSPQVARASLQSWNAHLAHGHTLRLRRRLFRDLPTPMACRDDAPRLP
jgi:RNA-directed DNA polymerase